MILKSETYNFHRLDLTRQVGFVVTIYDEDGLRLAATMPFSTPAEAFAEARKIVDNKVEGPRNNSWAAACGKIGIGGSLAAPPLPHHRAYGSVHGGSLD